jgi:hypothetical protein
MIFWRLWWRRTTYGINRASCTTWTKLECPWIHLSFRCVHRKGKRRCDSVGVVSRPKSQLWVVVAQPVISSRPLSSSRVKISITCGQKVKYLAPCTALVQRDGLILNYSGTGSLITFFNMHLQHIHCACSWIAQLSLPAWSHMACKGKWSGDVPFPPHTTADSQPLDVGVFGPLKVHWRNVCHE